MDQGTVIMDHLDRTIVVLELVGDITAASEGALIQAYQTAGKTGARSLVLDFNRMTYII